MATERRDHGFNRVTNTDIWSLTRVLFLGSALLFLINILFGFNNAVTTGTIPRWMILIHLHAGAIGWITLSLIGLAIWIFTGTRSVSQAYVRWIRWLVWLAILVFAGYILAFGIAFSQTGEFLALLPIFGIAAALVIWATVIYAFTQLSRQPVVTTVHVLVAGGLLVAAVGGTMGFLLGLEYVVGVFLPIEVPDRVGVHAGMMDAYILLVASAIVEWFVLKDTAGHWTWPGLAQAIAGTVAAILVPIAFLTNRIEQLLPIFAVFLLIFLALFLVRMGWRAIRANPLHAGPDAWGFFGALWLVVYVVMFLYAAVGLQGNFGAAPDWFPAVFAHAGFVGMMTNLLFGVYSVRTRRVPDRFAWSEPAALWLVNLGLVVFAALKIAIDIRHGAVLMGLGVLWGVGLMIHRLRASAD